MILILIKKIKRNKILSQYIYRTNKQSWHFAYFLNKIKYDFYKYRLTKIVDIYKIQLYLNI